MRTRITVAAIILIAIAPRAVAVAPALTSHTTVISIQEDGSAAVVEHAETAAARLQWSTPTTYPAPLGIRLPRVVKLVDVADELDTPLRYSQRHYRDHLSLSIEVPAAGQIKISYIVQNAVRFLADRDELLWVAGEGWRGPVRASEVSVRLPASAAGQFRMQVTVRSGGKFLRLADAAVEDVNARVRSDRPLSANESLIADLVVPKGILHEPSFAKRAAWFARANPILIVPFFVLVVMLLARTMRARAASSIAPQYEPPAKLTPAEAGLLIDDQLDPRDISATLVDLAVRGYLKVEECKPDEGVPFQGQDFAVRLLKPREQWSGLAPHESIFLFHTFYGGQWTKLSSLHLRFYGVLPIFRQAVVGRLQDRGMYRFDPQWAQVYRLAGVIGFLAVLLILQALGLVAISDSALLSAVVIGLSAGLVYWLGQGLTPKTTYGLKTYAALRGFEQFMDTVERDRLERMPNELFEKWLPYAMALGVEHHWAENFSAMATAPPLWFQSTSGDFHPEIFDLTRWSRVHILPRGMTARRDRLARVAGAS